MRVLSLFLLLIVSCDSARILLRGTDDPEIQSEEDDLRELAERVAHRVLVTRSGLPMTKRAELKVEEEDLPVDDPLAVFNDIRKRLGTLGELNGKNVDPHKTSAEESETWGAELSRSNDQLGSVAASFREAVRNDQDGAMVAAELEAQIESAKKQLEEKIASKNDPAPETPFEGGLSVFFKDEEDGGKTWGEGDKHIVGVALKQQYEHGPLVCLCTISCAGNEEGSLLGPVGGTTCCKCLNQPISNVLPELSDGTLGVDEPSTTAAPVVVSEEEVEEETEADKTTAGRRLRALIEGALKPGATYDFKSGPVGDKELKLGNPPPWLVKDLTAWGQSLKDEDNGATGIAKPKETCAEIGANDGVTAINETHGCLCGKAETHCPDGFYCCSEAGKCAAPERYGECSSIKFPEAEDTSLEDKRHATLAEWVKSSDNASKKKVQTLMNEAEDLVHLARVVPVGIESAGSKILKEKLDDVIEKVEKSPKEKDVVDKMKNKSGDILHNDDLKSSLDSMNSALDAIEQAHGPLVTNSNSSSPTTSSNSSSSSGSDSVDQEESYTLQDLSDLAEDNARAAAKIAALAGQVRLDAREKISAKAAAYLDTLANSTDGTESGE